MALPDAPPPLTMSVSHAAVSLGVSVRTIWRLIEAGRLDVARIGGRTLVLTSSLERLVAES